MIVHTPFSPLDAGYSPLTSQNGYIGSMQSLSLPQVFTRFVHPATNTSATIHTFDMDSILSRSIMLVLSTGRGSGCVRE